MLPSKRKWLWRYFSASNSSYLTNSLVCFSYSLKNSNPAKQEHARLEVENAEDDLVQKTEVAITLMKAVLDNVRDNVLRCSASGLQANPPLQPEPIKNLNELIKAQVRPHRPFLESSP